MPRGRQSAAVVALVACFGGPVAAASDIEEVDIPSLDRPTPEFRPAPETGPAAPNPDIKRIIVLIGPEGGFEDAMLAGGLRRYRPGCRETLNAHCGIALPDNIEAVCGPLQRKTVVLVDRAKPFPGSLCFGASPRPPKKVALPLRKPLAMPAFAMRGDATIIQAVPGQEVPRKPETATPRPNAAEPDSTPPIIRAPAELQPVENVGRLAQRRPAPVADAPPPPATKPIFGARGWDELKEIPKVDAPAAKPEPPRQQKPVAAPARKPTRTQTANRTNTARTAKAQPRIPTPPPPPTDDSVTSNPATPEAAATITFGTGDPVVVLIADSQRRFTGTWFAFAGDNAAVPDACRQVLAAAKGSRIPSSIDLICGTTQIYQFGSVQK